VTLAVLTALSAPALAQDAPDSATATASGDALQEVVVNARKREENSQDVPISIVALSGDQLERSHASLASDIVQSVPNMQLQFINPRQTAFSVRGIGNNPATEGLETSVGLYLDGVYISRPGMLTSDLSDIEQVAVLRGPQGTLFGKNTTAGALSITTRKPESVFGGSAELTGGRFGLAHERVTVTGPITESLSGRVSVFHTGRDGTIDDASGADLNNLNKTGGRAQLYFAATDTFNVRLITDYTHQQEDSGAQVLVDPGLTLANGSVRPNNVFVRGARLGYAPQFDPFSRRVNISQRQSMETTNKGVSAEANWTLGGYTLTSVSAWRGWEFLPTNDLDYLPLDIQHTGGGNIWNRQTSQEFRVASPTNRAIDFVAGAYLYWQRLETATIPGPSFGADAAAFFSQPNLILPSYALEGLTSYTRADANTDSYALFGQATWHISDSWSLTAGARSNWDDKEALVVRARSGGAALSPTDPLFAAITAARNQLAPPAATASNRNSDNTVSGLLSLSYKPVDEWLLYTSLARGVKSGGLNTSITPAGVNPVVQPEIAKSAEIGFKSTRLDRRLQVDFDLFWSDIDNYQTTVRDQLLLASYLANAESVRSRGAELEAAWLPLEGLRVATALGYNEATYRSFRNSPCGTEWAGIATSCDLTGKQVSGAPRWSGTARVDYSHALGGRGLQGYGGLEYTFKSSSYYTSDDSRYSLIDSYGLVNLQVGLKGQNERWEVSLWARNLLDKNYFTALNAPSGGVFGTGYVVGTVGDPRTFGVTFRIGF